MENDLENALSDSNQIIENLTSFIESHTSHTMKALELDEGIDISSVLEANKNLLSSLYHRYGESNNYDETYQDHRSQFDC